jgi:hypothetical protein
VVQFNFRSHLNFQAFAQPVAEDQLGSQLGEVSAEKHEQGEEPIEVF